MWTPLLSPPQQRDPGACRQRLSSILPGACLPVIACARQSQTERASGQGSKEGHSSPVSLVGKVVVLGDCQCSVQAQEPSLVSLGPLCAE